MKVCDSDSATFTNAYVIFFHETILCKKTIIFFWMKIVFYDEVATYIQITNIHYLHWLPYYSGSSNITSICTKSRGNSYPPTPTPLSSEYIVSSHLFCYSLIDCSVSVENLK